MNYVTRRRRFHLTTFGYHNIFQWTVRFQVDSNTFDGIDDGLAR